MVDPWDRGTVDFLVINDVPRVRKRLARWLARNGNSSVFAETEEEADALLEGGRFDVIVRASEIADRIPDRPRHLPSPMAAFLAALGVAVIAYLIFPHNGDAQATVCAPGSECDQVARHLTESGAVMYGAFWCPYCDKQKKLFGTAFDLVNYVECDPGGANANPALCKTKGIRGFPTWEIRGTMYPGLRSLSELGRLSGFQQQ